MANPGYGSNRRRSSQYSAIMVVDMGIHELKDYLEAGNLVQALTPGLEDRARFHKKLGSKRQVSPGYFDAPCTSQSFIRRMKHFFV